jgi:mannose-6-phosphate isomerase-like protein (cupin superfamily)
MRRGFGLGALALTIAVVTWAGERASPETTRHDGFVIERDAEVAEPAPGPHGGTGQTTGHVFFDKVPGLAFSFRKRVLHPGSSIGYHEQKQDEVYYMASGTGRMTIDGRAFDVKAGDALLTRPGSSHGLVQTGAADLVVMIVFEKKGPD